MDTLDYIIIGGGPGGYELAAAAAAKGLKVALIERDKLGGTCLNRGCIPTKAMAFAAETLRQAREGGVAGIVADDVKVDFPMLTAYRDGVVDNLRQGVEAALAKVRIIRGSARLLPPKNVEVDGEILTADKIVIATGSAPAFLPIPGAETAITSDELLSLPEVPRSMVIIGGGVIGMEFASIFNTLGAKVTVVEYCKEILPQFDKDIAKRLRSRLAADGIDFFVGSAVTSIDGGTVCFEGKTGAASVTADVVVMAVGRRPVLPDGLEEVGVEKTPRGAVSVNPQTFETSVPGIYAVGDCNALCMLAHAASAQGRRVLGEDVNLHVVPSVVFTSPEVAMVGASEASLKDAGVSYKTVKSLYRANGKAMSMNATDGLLKLTYDPDSRLILGCSVMGPHAADLVQEVALAMAFGLAVDAIAATIHAHPTLSEILFAAALQASAK